MIYHIETQPITRPNKKIRMLSIRPHYMNIYIINSLLVIYVIVKVATKRALESALTNHE